MKTYVIVLMGNKALEVDERTAKEVEKVWKDKTERIIKIGGNMIASSMIKAIMEKDVPDMTKTDLYYNQINQEFDQDCRNHAALPLEEKVKQEIDVRIAPIRFRKNGTIHPDLNHVIIPLKQLLRAFFIANPKYPRCPSRLWFPILKPYLLFNKNKTITALRFYEYVAHNDLAIAEWAKYNHIPLITNLQMINP